MTTQEKIIVSAYTGYLMCDPYDLNRYISEKVGRSVFTHELGTPDMWDEIRRAVHDDFIALCND